MRGTPQARRSALFRAFDAARRRRSLVELCEELVTPSLIFHTTACLHSLRGRPFTLAIDGSSFLLCQGYESPLEFRERTEHAIAGIVDAATRLHRRRHLCLRFVIVLECADAASSSHPHLLLDRDHRTLSVTQQNTVCEVILSRDFHRYCREPARDVPTWLVIHDAAFATREVAQLNTLNVVDAVMGSDFGALICGTQHFIRSPIAITTSSLHLGADQILGTLDAYEPRIRLGDEVTLLGDAVLFSALALGLIGSSTNGLNMSADAAIEVGFSLRSTCGTGLRLITKEEAGRSDAFEALLQLWRQTLMLEGNPLHGHVIPETFPDRSVLIAYYAPCESSSIQADDKDLFVFYQ